ncbi:hypothetical protein [Pseudomonas sp. MF7453]|uniref:hypothetical protein n=1 Tax=Pseudomonas sp. MF7453 TaxID=2797539 RepID=UPI0018E7BB7F|nr:hypothetical protein [Pseudomonas sp. MF7453]MBJ2216493.1 hypothetical protein [Pseudomonas sp. MF7453]
MHAPSTLRPDSPSKRSDGHVLKPQPLPINLMSSAAWAVGLDFDYSKRFSVPRFILIRQTNPDFANFVLTKSNISLSVLAHILHTLHQLGKQAAFQFPPHFSALRQRMRKTKKPSRQTGLLPATPN